MNKKKKFFACSACLLGFFICSCEVMADAPDDVIISILNNYPDYFKQNNIIFDVIRWISWLLITLLRVIANFCVTLYEYSLGLLTLISENINKFVPYAHELFTVILAISLLAMGIMLIVHPKKKPDLLLSLFLMVMALSLQTVILNPMIAPTQAAIRELSMTNSIVDRIVNSHIHDLLYIDQKLPNGLIDLASGDIDIASLTINLTDKQINNIDVNEVLNYKSNRLSEGAKGQDGILGKKLEIYYDENEVENRELVDVDNGFGWNSEDDADFFNEFYYRYKIDSIEIIISLLAIIIVYLFMAAKVIKIVFEIVMGNIIAIYYSANLNGPQKVLQIFKEILNCFIVLLLTGVLIRMFVISETIIYELELSGLAYGFLLIFVAIAVIQGPNIIQKIIGIDAGISDGLGTLFALSQGANLTASGVKGASSVIGSAGRGIGSIKQTISDKISSAKSASADNGLGSDIQTPPSMHNSEENDMSQKGTKSNSAEDSNSSSTPNPSGSFDDTKETVQTPPSESETFSSEGTYGSEELDTNGFVNQENADIPPDIDDTNATMPPTSNMQSDLQNETVQQSSDFSMPEKNNNSLHPDENKNASAIERTFGSLDLSTEKQKSNYETYKEMDTAYKNSQTNELQNTNGISGIGAANTTSMNSIPNWKEFSKKGK